MKKNNFIIIIAVVFCFFIIGCTKTTNSVSSNVSIKYGDNEVENISIGLTITEFNVVGSAVNGNINYKIFLQNNSNEEIESTGILEELDVNDSIISSKSFNILSGDNVIYEGSIISGEVAYGKKFRLTIYDDNFIDNANNYMIKIVK